jgi:hypothetical protein
MRSPASTTVLLSFGLLSVPSPMRGTASIGYCAVDRSCVAEDELACRKISIIDSVEALKQRFRCPC